MTQEEIIQTFCFQMSYWMFIIGLSVALTGFLLGLLVAICAETGMPLP